MSDTAGSAQESQVSSSRLAPLAAWPATTTLWPSKPPTSFHQRGRGGLCSQLLREQVFPAFLLLLICKLICVTCPCTHTKREESTIKPLCGGDGANPTRAQPERRKVWKGAGEKGFRRTGHSPREGEAGRRVRTVVTGPGLSRWDKEAPEGRGNWELGR